MECKTDCEISSALQDIKMDLTDIKNVIFRFDGIIAKQDKQESDCVNRSEKMELEMKNELEVMKNKHNNEMVEVKNKLEALQNRFTYIWLGISLAAPFIYQLFNVAINHLFK